jgi:hypothetical protein
MTGPDAHQDPVICTDGRQSETAAAIQRGVGRMLRGAGFACVPELSLANGRRADVLALGRKGEIWIVEIKSSPADYLSDNKWRDYMDFCDRFYFAIPPDMDPALIDEGQGSSSQTPGAQRSCGTRKRKGSPAHGARPLRLFWPEQLPCGCSHQPTRTQTVCFRWSRLPSARGALGENALQGAPVHVEPPCRLRHIAVAQFIDPLNVLPANAVS